MRVDSLMNNDRLVATYERLTKSVTEVKKNQKSN